MNNVNLLIGAGTEPHDYEPSAKAVATIQDAELLFMKNENMETWVPDLLKTLKNKKNCNQGDWKDALLPGGEEEDDHDHGEEGHHHE